MGSIIKMIGTLLAGIGLGSIMPEAELTPSADQDATNWLSTIAVGGIGVGMLLYWLLRKCKVIK